MARGPWGGAAEPHIFRVNVRFFMGASKCQWGFKLRDVAIQDNSAQDVANQVLAVLGDPFRALLTGNDGLEGVDVLLMGAEEGGWAPAPVQAGSLNLAADVTLPDFMCCNVTMKSEIRKRYGQGRFFLPVVYESDVNANSLNALGLGRVNSIVTLLNDNFTGLGVENDLLLVNAHRVLPSRGVAGQPTYRPEIPATWYDVVSLRVNSLVTSLRSRKAGVGS